MITAFTSSFWLEMSNGASGLVEMMFMALMVRYLYLEAKRRRLRRRDWFFRMPPSMHLAIAILVFDLGVWMRSALIWVWRKFYGAGEFSTMQLMVLGVGSLIIIIGSLCKIRAVTKPDLGNSPWLIALGVVVVFCALSAAIGNI